jgi:hypothetical protein
MPNPRRSKSAEIMTRSALGRVRKPEHGRRRSANGATLAPPIISPDIDLPPKAATGGAMGVDAATCQDPP